MWPLSSDRVMPSAVANNEERNPLRRRRYKTAIACDTCRRRKLKCDGQRPACSRCKESDRICTSDDPTGHRLRRVKGLEQPRAQMFNDSGDPAGIDENPNDEQEASTFASQVRSAVHTSLDLPHGVKRCPIPLLDAPLFGDLSMAPDQSFRTASALGSYEPSRTEADHVVTLYWERISPLRPLLDKDRFFKAFDKRCASISDAGADRVFDSILNAVFALATQLQETVPSKERDARAHAYFSRAWSLLRPESAVWSPASIDVVRCVLLLCQYLQCTRYLHHLWMLVGTAVRMAQSLGLHMATSQEERQTWGWCVYLDRNISLAIGRIPTACLLSRNNREPIETDNYSTQLAMLDQLTNEIVMSQVLPQGQSTSVPISDQSGDFNNAIKFDQRLNALASDTPSPASDARWLSFHISLLHARILIGRPSLTRLCLSTSTTSALETTFNHQLALSCLHSAQQLPSHLSNCLPWWHRLCHLYTASHILIAAKLRPDLFAVEFWDDVMKMLADMEHLSAAVGRFKKALEGMWEKAQRVNGRREDEEWAELVRHLWFETEHPFSGVGMEWLDGLDLGQV